MKGMRRIGFAGMVCLLGASLPLAADSITDLIIQKVEQHYNRARTLAVNFVEEYTVQGHRRPQESGKLVLRKQGKMRWDYTTPTGKVFLLDGKMIYLYTAADNRVERIPVKETEDMRAPLAFLLGHLDLKKEFRDFQARTDGGNFVLEANAKSDKAPYGRIQLHAGANGEITQLRVYARDESSMRFELSNEQVNVPVSDSLFAFHIPPGAEVVDAVEYAGEGR